MCVTDTTHRRTQGVSLASSAVQVCSPFVASQRQMRYAAQQTQPLSKDYSLFTSPEFCTVRRNGDDKPRPKRRRKPQKPGFTAKHNERHFVQHNYHDHASDSDENDVDDTNHRGCVSLSFPHKLHDVLEQVEVDGLSHVISWKTHGRCFAIHQPKEFVNHVMPLYFRQTKLTSFQRQLNLYGFQRLTRGTDSGGYYHELFLRGKAQLCKRMTRTKVKGTKFKGASSPESEPDFYTMPAVGDDVTPMATSDEEEQSVAGSQRSQDSFLMYPITGFSMPQLRTTDATPFPIQFTSFPTPFDPIIVVAAPDETDRVLDEAVEELFMEGEGDSLADFLQDWDPNSTLTNEPLTDDLQLGLLLEKLLE